MWSEAAEGVSMTVGPVAGASADPASELAALVRRSRVLARLTQEELAERTGLSSRTVRNIENGKLARPRASSVRLLADGLGLPAAEGDRLVELARGLLWRDRSGREEPGLRSGADSVPAAVPAQLPADVTGFVGRESELSWLDAAADHGDASPVPVCVISGAAGVGKTALVARKACRC
jgi:transcriptional regulator with XRE-family HTH domain